MQKWEYKSMLRTRGWEQTRGGGLLGAPSYGATAWSPAIEDVFVLGEEGWELVSVVALSSEPGWHPSSDFAGFTDSQLWVFKRPKP